MSKYWRQRFEMLENARRQDADAFIEHTHKAYIEAQREVQTQLEAFFGRFAKNNQVTMEEAKKLLNSKELEEFKWDLNTYIVKAKENQLIGQWTQQLQNASTRVHVSRLEALQMQMQQSVEKCFGGKTDEFDSFLKKTYLDTYYKAGFEIARGTGVGVDFAGINQKQLDRVIRKPWASDGLNFSQRIWRQREKLVDELHTKLSQGLMLGKSPSSISADLAKRFGVSKGRAANLVLTESAFFASVAEEESYRELGVEKFEVLVTLDDKTCPICGPMDGLVLPMAQYEIGTTVSPYHSKCRCTTIPHFEDDRGGGRIARDAEGKVYYVPADTTYEEWKELYVQPAGDASTDKPVMPVDVPKVSGFMEPNVDLALPSPEAQEALEIFVPAKNVEDAMLYSWEKFGIAADFTKYNLDVANAVNEEIFNVRQKFGKDAFGKIFKEIGTFPKGRAGGSTRNLGVFAITAKDKKGELWLRNVSLKNAIEKMSVYAKGAFERGHWSVGDWRAVIWHELGHGVEWNIRFGENSKKFLEEINALKRKTVLELAEEAKQKKAPELDYPRVLSKYGFTNEGEFVAESFSEYMWKGESSRPLALEVIEIIRKYL